MPPGSYQRPRLTRASPRWCARQDWEAATRILVRLRRLPADSQYVSNEIRDMADQLETEKRLTGDATTMTLLKEMVLIPGNRNRALISVVLMTCQQMTGVNAIVRALGPGASPDVCWPQARRRTTTLPRSSRTWA